MSAITQPSAPAAPTTAPLLIDTEKGRRSVGGFIRSGKIVVKTATTFKAAEDAIWSLMRESVKPSGIILDTLTGLVGVTILDVAKENPTGLWANRMSLAPSQQQWGIMGGIVMRLRRAAAALNIPFVITAHEGERRDEASGSVLHFPDLNPQVLKDLVANADSVLRLSRSSTILEANGKKYPVGSRAIRLQPNEQYYAKIRVPDDRPPAPDFIVNGSPNDWSDAIAQLKSISGGLFTPLDESGEISPVVIYGAPGVGKTRLAVELLLAE